MSDELQIDHRDEMQILLKLVALGDVKAAVDLSRRIQRQAARLAECEKANEWQPIETAPKDGTRILYGHYWNGRFGWAVSGNFANGQHQHDADHADAFPEQPTHWQPLPPQSRVGR